MIEFYQGDIIKISGYKNKFLIVSKNAFIKATNVFHVCPLLDKYPKGQKEKQVERSFVNRRN